MNTLWDLQQVPKAPGVYALCSGRDVAYVGVAKSDLRGRLQQHLVLRDSSATTGASAVSLNPDLVTEVRWWAHEAFEDAAAVEGAEIIASELLRPVMRSRGGVSERAKQSVEDPEFAAAMEAMFQAAPTGTLQAITLRTVIDAVEELQRRVQALEDAQGR